MKKLLLLAMVLGLLVSSNVLAENRYRLNVNTDVWTSPEPRWVQELRQNGTWSVEEATPQNLKGDAIARHRIYHPAPFPLISPEGYWYVGNGSPETVVKSEPNRTYNNWGGGCWNGRNHRGHRGRVK